MGGTTHGASSTRLYNIWSLMRARCSRPTHPDYPQYGGRGVIVVPEWEAFTTFQEWAHANGYQHDLTIDRQDNDGPYSPENCRWRTRKQQNRNRRNNQRYEWRGRSLMLSEIAEEAGLSYSMLRQRVQCRGWTLEEATTTPRDVRGGIRANIVF